MTLATFFEQFELLADAPNGVKKLRELILQLAVQGKLVSQDSQDEPALALLERIKLNKEQLVKAKQISKDEALASIESKDVPFLLPKNWEWAYLGQISNTIHYGYTASGNHKTSEVRLLRITDIQDNQVDWSMVPGCEIEPNKLKNYELKNGDILIARTGGTIGKSYLVKDISVCAVFASYLIRVVPNSLFIPRYLKLFLESPFYWKQLYSKSMGTGQPNVNATSLKSLYIPIPPLNEQQRIVEQVEHLMKMCDRLEEQQKKRRESCIRLNEGAIAQLLSASNAEESDRHWQRIYNNFDLFYNLPENISKLRKAIIQSASLGKLIQQSASDEPASSLLKKIKLEKEQLAKDKRVRKEEIFAPVDSEELMTNLPSGWTGARLGEVINCLDHLRKPINKEERQVRQGNIPYYGANGQVGWIDDFLFNEDLVLVVEDETFIGRQLPFCYKITGKSWVNNHAHVLQPTSGINVDFLNYSLSYYPFDTLTSGTTGRKKLTKSTLLNIPYMLPPLEEQKRIVARVNCLLKLCDELEAKLKDSYNHQEKLMEVAAIQLMQATAKTSALC